MNLRDVGSETSVNDSVQTNKMINKHLKCSTTTHREWMWSRALDVKLSEWCCSVSLVWVQIPSREEQKFDSSKI
jgi:hypothetical protein